MKLLMLFAIAASGVTLAGQNYEGDNGATERLIDNLSPESCADRIERVRDDLAQPRLDRSPASADKPLLIAAVDKRIDGCAVLQMKGNVNDLRPLPVAPSGPPRLQPAN